MQINIITRHIRPPIPTNRFDWMAYVEGEEEGGLTGYGPTEADAARELTEQLADLQKSVNIQSRPITMVIYKHLTTVM